MNSANKGLQRSALVMKILGWSIIVSLAAGLFLYPPGFLWGSHPATFPNMGPPHPESPLHALHPYLFMIYVLYLAYGILMIRGANDPKANAALFDYGILANVLHGLVMLVAAFIYPNEIAHLWADVPLAFAVPVILWIYHPNRVAPGTSPASAESYDKQPLEAPRMEGRQEMKLDDRWAMKQFMSCICTLVLAVPLIAMWGCKKSKQAPSTSEQARPAPDAATRAANENVKCEAQGDYADCAVEKNTVPGYSPYAGQDFPNRVYWGDTHHHTSFSFDAGFANPLGPEISYRFARGEEVTSSSGIRAKLSRPLDFLVVSDHAEFIGLPDLLRAGDPQLLKNEAPARWAKMMKTSQAEATKAAFEALFAIFQRKEVYKDPKITRSVWEKVTAIATKYNEPGHFSAFNGFEWTSAPGPGNNLHRVVIFRDGAQRANQVLPFSAFDSEDPEDLWKYLAGYEQKTGGQVLAIPHNGNMSNGRMFALTDLMGNPLTRQYAENRARWEPLAEVTQTKGDSETHPYLSSTDEFANFEHWDFGNMYNPVVPKQPDMLQYEYARSALKLGLKLEKQLGVNPYKFGMIGSTDTHTSLSSFDEDNFFGKLPSSEPNPERWKEVFLFKADKTPAVAGWEIQAAGIVGVWARENTREALFDAMKRKEVYASTGPRITVRVFAGWDFKEDDVDRPDFASEGYKRGVPMGGTLAKSSASGAAPTIMIRALRDPDGANLDRVQIIKGWLDGKDELHERIFDVAVSDGRKIGSDGRCKTSVGSTVDIPNATYTNAIGAPLLSGWWKDPDFNPQERAFYYIRVIQIPSPRWTAYDQKRFGIKMPDYVPMTVTERVYTSPVWYSPAQ